MTPANAFPLELVLTAEGVVPALSARPSGRIIAPDKVRGLFGV